MPARFSFWDPTVKASVVLIAALFAAVAVAANEQEPGRQLFVKDTTPPCALCHALASAGSEGTIGPSLDEMKPDAERVARVIRSGIGAMPPYPQLSDAQVKVLAEYVARNAGK